MKLSVTSSQLPAKELGVEREFGHRTQPRAWLWLIVGAGLLMFSYGANNIPLAAWFSPVFLLRFVHQQNFRVWVPVLYVAAIGAGAFQLRGMVPIPGLWYGVFWRSVESSFSLPSWQIAG